MQVKKELRKQLINKRKNITDKALKDRIICEKLIGLDLYKNAGTVLLYAALEDEINIDSVIADAFECGKKVALPKCLDSNGNMRFYYIDSLSDLAPGHYGIREPDISCRLADEFDASLCVVPAVAYDKSGFRLGYGGGYYDRFLKNYISNTVGVCYNELITDCLPTDLYDIPVSIVITD